MSLKIQKIIFWIITIPVVIMMLISAVGLLTPWPQNVEGIVHFGYPLYFMTLLGVAKALGSAALLYRRFSTLTEWAYAGFTFEYLSASYSHYAIGDSLTQILVPWLFLAMLGASYYFWKKIKYATR